MEGKENVIMKKSVSAVIAALMAASAILAGCGSDAYVKRGTRLVEFATDGERVQQYLEAHR